MTHFDLEFDSVIPSAASWRQDYQRAEPWPHLVVDGAFDPALIAAAEQEQQAHSHELAVHRSHRQIKAESPDVVGPASLALVGILQSSAVTTLFSETTGVTSLEPDRTNFFAGVHATGPGGFSAVHRDFPKHPFSGLFHRVNALLFLNSNWEESYGGALELWDGAMEQCRKRILPVAGRLVIFETTADTLHGIPDPVRCPPDRRRLSLAVYYYSPDPPVATASAMPLWQPRRPEDPIWRSLPTIHGLTQAGRRALVRAAGNRPRDLARRVTRRNQR